MHGALNLWEILVGLGVIGILLVRRPRKHRTHPGKTEQANVRAGQVGENRTTTILRQAGLVVWPNVHVASGHRTSQCDHVVTGTFGLVVVETKHWTGTLDRGAYQQWSQIKPNGSVRWYASPEFQNAYHCQVVRDVLRGYGLQHVPVYGAIGLSNPHARFAGGPGPQPIGTPAQIAAWIQQLPPGRAFDAGRVERVLRQSGAGVVRATPWE